MIILEWLEIKLNTLSEAIEPVCGVLYEAGITGLQIDDLYEMQDFLANTKGNWDYVEDALLAPPDREPVIIFYLSDNEYGHDILLSIKNAIKTLKERVPEIDFGSLSITVNNVSDEKWLNEWKKYYKPFKIGKSLVVRPEWESYDKKENENVLTINPGHLFGTGLHQTTALCLEAIEKHMKSGLTVLDLGCGSGILSIASLIFGASYACAVDLDENAVNIVYENAGLNGFDKNSLKVIAENVLDEKKIIEKTGNLLYNVVVANIVADVIIAILPIVYNTLDKDGIFISSGIIDERINDVLNAVEDNGFFVEEQNLKDGWVMLVLKKRV